MHRIVVSRTAGDNVVGTLRDALSKAGPGDTIVIAEPRLTESKLTLDRTKHRDLTIETADGKPVIVEASGTLGTMFEAKDVEGLKLKNIEFDGKGQAEHRPSRERYCSRYDHRGRDGPRCQDGWHQALDRGRRLGSAHRARPLPRAPHWPRSDCLLAIRGRCGYPQRHTSKFPRRGDEPGTGIRIEGACTDLVVSGGRFFNLDEAIAFDQPPTDKITKGHITSNTIYQAKTGLAFQMTPPPMSGEPGPAASR